MQYYPLKNVRGSLYIKCYNKGEVVQFPLFNSKLLLVRELSGKFQTRMRYITVMSYAFVYGYQSIIILRYSPEPRIFAYRV